MTFHKADAEQLIIDPVLFARDLYYQPHLWSFVKEKFNYQEPKTPRGACLKLGDAQAIASDNPKDWSKENFYDLERYSLTATGNVQEHVYTDSTLFFYNQEGFLRQTTAYKNPGYSDEIEYIRLYNYDGFGNLLWNAVFFQDDEEMYLDHYESFRYKAVDSGHYVKRDHYFVDDPETQELEHSQKFAFINSEGVLKREYEVYGTNDGVFTEYEYQEMLEHQQIRKTIVNIRSWVCEFNEIHRTDTKGRIVLQKIESFIESAPFVDQDSSIYTGNFKQTYVTSASGLYSNARMDTKYDDFGNMILREIYDLNSETPDRIDIKTENQNFYLPSGTVEFQISNEVYWDGKTSRDYYWMEFTDTPYSSHNPTYQDDPNLIGLIEKCIPPEKR